MSENPHFLIPRGIPRQLVTSENLAAGFAEIWYQRRHPPSKDEVISAMWAAYPGVLVDAPVFKGGDLEQPFGLEIITRRLIEEQDILMHPDDTVGVPRSEVIGRLRMGLQNDVLEVGAFPLSQYSKADWWEHFLKLRHDKERLRWLRFIISNRPPTTNKERYGPLEVIRQMAAIACQQSFNLWEGGSSVQIGVKATQLKHQYPFKEPLVRRRTRPGNRGATRFIQHREGTQAYSRLLGRPALRGEIVCTDMYPEGNDLQRQLFKAALRPSEIGDMEFMAIMQHLMDARLPNIRFLEGDITDARVMNKIGRACSDIGLRFAFLGTMLNQVGQENVEKTITNSLNLLDEDGVLLITEFAHVDPAHPHKLQLTSQWRDWTYRLFAIHKRDPERTVHELMRFKNSRMEELLIGTGLLDLGDDRGYRPMQEQLVYTAERA